METPRASLPPVALPVGDRFWRLVDRSVAALARSWALMEEAARSIERTERLLEPSRARLGEGGERPVGYPRRHAAH